MVIVGSGGEVGVRREDKESYLSSLVMIRVYIWGLIGREVIFFFCFFS